VVITVAGVHIVVSYAARESGIKLSVRSTNDKVKANDLVRHLVEGCGVGGGHDNMAGGFIPKENVAAGRLLDTFIKHRAIAFYEMRS
jgi:single-stranded DNA-specific DHH superfamily exonuclease